MAVALADKLCSQAEIYTPLSQNQVRFIEILPCDAEEAPVSCLLKIAEIGPDTRYAALSYVWGDPEITKDIMVNGVVMPVTVNLESALRQFRKTGFPDDEETRSVTQLWADAICINQRDIPERNQQVTMMASIYRNATLVLSWLGPPDENCHDLAFQIISKILLAVTSSARDPSESIIIRAHKAARAGFEWLVGNLGTPIPITNRCVGWRALNNLVENKYWYRMWIVQEMALARKPSAHWFMCGAELISDQQLRRFQTFLALFRGPNPPYIDIHDSREDSILKWLSDPSLFNVPTETAVRLVQKQIDLPREGCLVECICRSAFGVSATDPRDLVYALIGMVPNRIQTDYNKSTRDVYIDAILSDGIVKCLPFLLRLSGLGYAYENDHNLPSWVPDFSKLNKFNIDHFTKIGGRRPSFLPPTIELQPPEIAQRDVLRIQGVAYDRVKLVKKTQVRGIDESFLGRYLRRICVEYLEELSGLDSIESEDERFRWCLVNKPLETLIDVLSCGNFPKDDFATVIGPGNTSLPKHSTVFLLDYLFDGIPFTEDVEPMAVRWSVIQPNQPLDPILAAALVGHKIWDVVDVLASPIPEIRYVDTTKLVDFYTSISQVETKALFKTDKGQLGIGPLNIKTGDVVCALDQSQFPSSLRRDGSHWEHVGVCYVKELPSVDAAEVFKTEQMKVETFDIY